ncbi:hypothetical protein Tco_0274613, partial [Tanacetum coccineum]
VAATEPSTIQNVILKVGVLTDEAVRNGSLKRNDGESSKEWNINGDNKRARTGKCLPQSPTLLGKSTLGSTPKCTNCNFHHNPETPCPMCTNCNRLWHFAKDYRAEPRMVNPLNAKNLIAVCGVCYEGVRGRAFMMGAEEARQDPNIVMALFPLPSCLC